MNLRGVLHVVSNSGRCSIAASVIMMLVVALLPASQALAKEKPPFVAEVVSSAADQVTGGDTGRVGTDGLGCFVRGDDRLFVRGVVHFLPFLIY